MRNKDMEWDLPKENSWEGSKLSVLMDIRDELKAINLALRPLQHLNCSNFLAIPMKLDKIAANTRKKKRKVRKTA